LNSHAGIIRVVW